MLMRFKLVCSQSLNTLRENNAHTHSKEECVKHWHMFWSVYECVGWAWPGRKWCNTSIASFKWGSERVKTSYWKQRGSLVSSADWFVLVSRLVDRNQRMSRLSKMREEAHRKWVCGAFNGLSLGAMGPMSTLKVCFFDKETHGTSVEAAGDEK